MAVDTLARTIAAAKARGGGGSGLPAVTSDDNGDVLAVVNGAWAKSSNALPSVTSGSNGMILQVLEGKWQKSWFSNAYVAQDTAEEDPDDPGTFWCTMRALDMYDAFHLAGVMINDSLVINATVVQDEVTGENQYTFTVLSINNGTVSAITYTADGDDDGPHYTA